jgi:hypothetical protein
MKWIWVAFVLLQFTTTAEAQVIEEWVRSSGASTDAITKDGGGNVFVTGEDLLGTNFLDYDYVTVGYSSVGVPLWTNIYNGAAKSWDTALGIVAHTNGTVFVTGYSDGGTSGYDYATIAYSNMGMPLWTNRYNGPGNNYDFAKAIAVDNADGVFVTGYSTGSGSSYDFSTIKYSNAGVAVWTNRYNGAANNYDRANAMAVYNGNIFVTGWSWGIGGYDYATVAYSNAGIPLWTNRFNGSGNGDDRATAIETDKNGNVFVTGSSTNNSSGYDFITVAYSNTGLPLWTNSYDGPAHGNEYANAIAVNSEGDVFVTGSSRRVGDLYDSATIAYSNIGIPLWTNRYTGIGGDNGSIAIAVDCNNNVFVTGNSSASVIDPYFSYVTTTLVYTGKGVPISTNRHNVRSSASAIVIDESGNAFVTGSLTIKYSFVKPRLDFQQINNQLVLSWTNASFRLQSSSDIDGSFTNISGVVSPYTNSFAPQQFFRLILN